jgi:hypothetical protein
MIQTQEEIDKIPTPSLWTYSYSGRKVGPKDLSPTLDDISIALGRICRYAGNGVRFYPVLLHSFVVADLVPKNLKVYALLHDSSESLIGDIPRGFKTEENKVVEDEIMRNILKSFGLPKLDEYQQQIIKNADNEALCGEVYTVGAWAIRPHFPDRSPHAEELTLEYCHRFPVKECVEPSGLAVLEYRKRVLDCLGGD